MPSLLLESRCTLRRSLPAGLLPLAALLLPLLAALLSACGGGPSPGGKGSLRHAAGQPDLLVLEGSPYQMGWWHGHLLRSRIIALHGRWESLLFQATVGAPTIGKEGGGAAGDLRELCELCEDQARHNLSEAMLQELDGLAAATGLEPRELLWLDVIRDALRMKGLPARLVGALGLARTPSGFEARGWWTGPDAQVLADEGVVIRRRPIGGMESLTVSWPGSLGAVAALMADGRGYVLAAAEVRDERVKGFGAGRPLIVAAREALLDASSVGHFMALTKATMGHVLLGFSIHPVEGEHPAQAMAAFVYYVDPEPPRVLGQETFLAIAPYENPNDPRARALRVALQEDASDADACWPSLGRHADAEGNATGTGPQVVVRYEAGRGTLSFARSAGAEARVVVLEDQALED